MSESDSNKKQISAEFVQAVKKYLEVDDKLREIKDRTKKLNTEKKEKQEYIINYLTSIEESIIDVVDGKLKKTITKSQAPLKKELIHKALTDITGDSIKAQSMTETIINSRPTVERINLKRTKNKTPRE
jgi:hypothetical protein